jgi:uncharacterized membrane protein
MTMMGYGAGLGFGFGSGGLLVALGCVALVVGLVLLAIWALGRTGHNPAGQAVPQGSQLMPSVQDPVELLRMRLARGEITVDEFTSLKQALENGR